MQDGWEILTDYAGLNRKGARMMLAMADAAPRGSRLTDAYTGTRRGLMLYGPGSPVKLPIVQGHLRLGGRVAMWDLGYWDRDDSLRLSIDALHPTPSQLSASPALPRRHFELREDADPEGPILLIGLGRKSVFAYGLKSAYEWELQKVRQLRERFPHKRIEWRPKGEFLPLLDLTPRHGMPIDEALRGCSMVVCRHSNVGVDACVAGVPVECEDGAAEALYRGNPSPTREQRGDFLSRLSWWNWSRHQAPQAWDWVQRMTQ